MKQANRSDGRSETFKLSFCAGADLKNDPPTSSTKLDFTAEKQITPRVKLTRIDVIIKYQFLCLPGSEKMEKVESREKGKLRIIMDVTKRNLSSCIVLMVNYMRISLSKRGDSFVSSSTKSFHSQVNSINALNLKLSPKLHHI